MRPSRLQSAVRRSLRDLGLGHPGETIVAEARERKPGLLRARLVDLEPRAASLDGAPLGLERLDGRPFVAFRVAAGGRTRLELGF